MSGSISFLKSSYRHQSAGSSLSRSRFLVSGGDGSTTTVVRDRDRTTFLHCRFGTTFYKISLLPVPALLDILAP